MSKTFYVGFLGAAALAALLFLPSTASGQPYIIIDEVEVATYVSRHGVYGYLNRYDNYTSVDTATVNNGGWLSSQSSTITAATVNGGLFQNTSGGVIDTVEVNDGILQNLTGGTINTATVNGGGINNGGGFGICTINTITVSNNGYFTNSGTINTATVNGGEDSTNSGTIINLTHNSGEIHNYGTITNLTVNGDGWIVNWFDTDCTIATATINDNGWLVNGNTINTVTVNDNGTFTNDGTVNSLTQNGGVVNNRDRYNGISEMTYVDGTYKGRWTLGNNTVYYGRIGTLTLAGDAANNTGDWGIIENLVFDNGGNGLITFTASANTMAAVEMAFDGLLPASSTVPGISFYSNITAQNIDFTYGNIAFDLSGLAGFAEEDVLSSLFAGNGFMVASLFGTARITGMDSLNSFQLVKGDEWFYVLNDGVIANGWGFANGRVSWDGMTAIVWESAAEVPEPATLVILGLGLAGLPVVRRLRRG